MMVSGLGFFSFLLVLSLDSFASFLSLLLSVLSFSFSFSLSPFFPPHCIDRVYRQGLGFRSFIPCAVLQLQTLVSCLRIVVGLPALPALVINNVPFATSKEFHGDFTR